MWSVVGYYSEFRFRPVSSGRNFKKFRPVPVPAGTFKFGSGAPLDLTEKHVGILNKNSVTWVS